MDIDFSPKITAWRLILLMLSIFVLSCSGTVVKLESQAKRGYEFSHSWYLQEGDVLSKNSIYEFDAVRSMNNVGTFKKRTMVPLVSAAEQKSLKIAPNYGSRVFLGELVLATRYIGDDFVRHGVSKSQSGAVNHSGEIQLVINTKELDRKGLYRHITGGGPHIWLSKNFDSGVFPWREEDQELVLSVKAAVPYVSLEDDKGNTASHGFNATQAPVTQLSFGLYIRDKVSGITFAYIVPMYESRGSYQESANAHDTFVSFVSTPADRKSTYITLSDTSAELQAIPYDDKRFFEILLTRANLQKVIFDSNEGLSRSIEDYELTMAGILFELPNYVKDGHNVSVAELSDFNVIIRDTQ